MKLWHGIAIIPGLLLVAWGIYMGVNSGAFSSPSETQTPTFTPWSAPKTTPVPTPVTVTVILTPAIVNHSQRNFYTSQAEYNTRWAEFYQNLADAAMDKANQYSYNMIHYPAKDRYNPNVPIPYSYWEREYHEAIESYSRYQAQANEYQTQANEYIIKALKEP
jgi:hypothetical protein